MTFADLVDAWVTWGETSGASHADQSDEARLHAFVVAHCERQGIAPAFYLSVAQLEFGGA